MSRFLQWEGATLEAGWQGIEYLSIDFEAPGSAAVLTVHLREVADGLQERDLVVSGGRRVTGLGFTVVFPDDGMGNRTREVQLAFDRLGDHSAYTVTLRSGGALPLHPFFASSDFLFTIDCPSGDCAPEEASPATEERPRPALDLLTKDYRGFVRLLTERVKVTTPSWADLSRASLERTLLELLAWQGDMLSYFQDRVAAEATLSTASQRHSLRQHGVLLGYDLDDGEAATTLLAFSVGAEGYVPAGLTVCTDVPPGEARVHFYTATRTRVSPARNGGVNRVTALAGEDVLQLAAWPDAATASLPVGATEILLWGHDFGFAAGDRIALCQGDLTELHTVASVAETRLPGWARWHDEAPPGPQSEVTLLTLAEPLEGSFLPWDEETPFSLLGNLVEATQGRPAVAWLNRGAGRARVRSHVLLTLNGREDITVTEVDEAGAETTLLRALRLPGEPALFVTGDDGRPEPSVTVTVDDEVWSRVEHLHRSQPYDPHYTVSADNDGTLWLQFGDGRRGRRIEVDSATDLPTSELRFDWRTGDPVAGNCGRFVLTRVLSPGEDEGTRYTDYVSLGAVRVTNVTRGAGGTAAESLDAARLAIPDSIRHGERLRAVTVDDYAEVAMQVDGVARAAARALGGPFNTVLVLVDPDDQAELPESLRAEVASHLEERRMTGREVIVRGPDYVPLEVELGLCVNPGWEPWEVRDRVAEALRPGAEDSSGFFHPDVLSFGEDVELGDVLAVVQAVPGVRSVHALTFRRLLEPGTSLVEERIALAATEVARLDADEDYPENGVLKLLLVGVDVTETQLATWIIATAEAS